MSHGSEAAARMILLRKRTHKQPIHVAIPYMMRSQMFSIMTKNTHVYDSFHALTHDTVRIFEPKFCSGCKNGYCENVRVHNPCAGCCNYRKTV